jgi:hypothetical protein
MLGLPIEGEGSMGTSGSFFSTARWRPQALTLGKGNDHSRVDHKGPKIVIRVAVRIINLPAEVFLRSNIPIDPKCGPFAQDYGGGTQDL